MNNHIVFYGAAWCPDCRRARALLDELGCSYEYIDLNEHPEAVQKVLEINGGYQSIPTILFPDGKIFRAVKRRVASSAPRPREEQFVDLPQAESSEMKNQGKHHSQIEFSQIMPNISLGTNLCCTLKPHVQVLLDLGITAEINLEMERTDTLPDVPLYLWIPVPDKTAPTFEQLVGGVGLIDHMVKHDKNVYIHCQYGHGRSPTLLAAYFISKGMSVEDAIGTIQGKRPEIHLELVQRQALEDFISS